MNLLVARRDGVVVQWSGRLRRENVLEAFSMSRVFVAAGRMEIVPQLLEVDLAILILIASVENLLGFKHTDGWIGLLKKREDFVHIQSSIPIHIAAGEGAFLVWQIR